MALINRRSALGVLGGLAAVPPVLARTELPDFGQPATIMLALQKMLASCDPAETVLSFAAGRVYGCLSGRPPIPLFGTHSVAACRALARDDGTFVLRQHIVGFRTSFGTETIVDRMRNPVTQQMIDLPLTDYGIGEIVYGANGVFVHLPDGNRVQLGQGGRSAWTIDGDVLAVNDDSLVAQQGPNQPKVDVVTRYANLREIVDPRVMSANSWFSFSAVDPFRPWLKMPEPGFQLWHVAGRKVGGGSALPVYIQKFIAERFPRLRDLPPIEP